VTVRLESPWDVLDLFGAQFNVSLGMDMNNCYLRQSQMQISTLFLIIDFCSCVQTRVYVLCLGIYPMMNERISGFGFTLVTSQQFMGQ
jgi:predicted Kef-type K+ transport protein